MSTIKDVYSVYDPASGQIEQSNKVYDDPDNQYGKVLAEREMKFVNHAGPTHAHLGRQFVSKGKIRDMEEMPVRIDRTSIGIGEANGATLTNVPAGAQLTIYATVNGIDTMFFPRAETGETGIVPGRRVDICAPVPGIYTLVITKFPYREWRQQVIAQ